MKDPRSLPATIASTVLYVGTLDGDQALYEQYVGKLEALAAQPEEYYRFLNALPWFRDPALIKRTLDHVLSPAVRTQDTGTLLGTMMQNPWSQEMAWSFVQMNWQRIVTTLGAFQGIPSIIESLEGSARPRVRRECARSSRKTRSGRRNAESSKIERIENCLAVKERQAKPFASWIAQGARK